ncbi:MAG: putative sulfate exporter family transporter [Ilumatobacteraceae bacterium]
MAIPVTNPRTVQSRPDRGPLLPGLAVAFGLALVGIAVNKVAAAVSPHVVVVVLAALAANIGLIRPLHRPGLAFAGKRVLRAGIVLVGFRLSLSEVVHLGPRAILAVCVVVTITFFGTQYLGRKMGLSRSLSLLVATGYSICGASAIAAAEPFSDATEEEVAYAIALVTLCGSLAIGVLPVLGSLLHLSSQTFGSWVGASVHDVGQVVAAASTRDSTALKAAVIVKLTRVALLAPLLTGVAIAARRRTKTTTEETHLETAKRPPLLPLFVGLFLVAIVIRSTDVLSSGLLDAIKQVETLLIGMGLAGLGSAVDIRRLRVLGGRPLVLGVLSWVLVAGAALAAVSWTGG